MRGGLVSEGESGGLRFSGNSLVTPHSFPLRVVVLNPFPPVLRFHVLPRPPPPPPPRRPGRTACWSEYSDSYSYSLSPPIGIGGMPSLPSGTVLWRTATRWRWGRTTGTTEAEEEEVERERPVCTTGARTKKPSTGAGTSNSTTTSSIVRAMPWVGLGRIIVARSKVPVEQY